MELNPQDLKAALLAKGVSELHHANTVATTVSFLRLGKLLSRARVENLGLPQTAQASDEIDQELGVWDLVFTDSVDIHQRAKKRNGYGPVLLELSLNVFDEPNISWVGVMKKNPTKWEQDEAQTARWFADANEVQNGFVKGRFDQMIVFQCENGELDVRNHLTRLLLDEPDVPARGKIDLHSLALGALAVARVVGDLQDVHILKRTCHKKCTCGSFYKNTHLRDLVMTLFDPRESG